MHRTYRLSLSTYTMHGMLSLCTAAYRVALALSLVPRQYVLVYIVRMRVLEKPGHVNLRARTRDRA